MSTYTTAEAAAETIVSRVAHLLAPAEHTRMVSSLMIDLTDDFTSELRSDPDGVVERRAIARALRTLHRTRMAAENARFETVTAQLTDIGNLITREQPVRANRHIAAAASAAAVIGSWFATAHVALESQTLVFRTRTESPVL